jgi:hypothetical protein
MNPIAPQQQPVRLNEFGQIVNGATSIAIGLLGTQPFCTYKTFSMVGQAAPPIHRLWAGYIPNAASGAPSESIAFFTHYIGKTILKQEDGSLSDKHNLILSIISGSIGAPINASLEQGMIRQQLEGGRYFTHMNNIYISSGWRGIFKGTGITAVRDGMFNCGVFAFFDYTKRKVSPFIPNPLLRDFTAGLLSGTVAGAISTPTDLIKTLIQSDKKGEYPTYRETAKKIIQKGRLLELGKTLNQQYKNGEFGFNKATIQKIKQTTKKTFKSRPYDGFFKGLVYRSITIGGLICFTAMLKERLPEYFPLALHQTS